MGSPGTAAGVERRAEHASVLAADDGRDVALVAELVIDDGPASSQIRRSCEQPSTPFCGRGRQKTS